jgi:hypothetical protein
MAYFPLLWMAGLTRTPVLPEATVVGAIRPGQTFRPNRLAALDRTDCALRVACIYAMSASVGSKTP